MAVRNIIDKANQHYAFYEWEEAFQLYKQIEHLSTSGHVNYRLGVMHLYGYYTPRDYDVAMKYFDKAFGQLSISSDTGNPEAQCDLGYMYDCGCGLPKIPEIAFLFYKLAADAGLQRAQFNLALLYDQGVGVTADIEKSMYYFRKAADQGYVNALCHLANMYRKGNPIANIQKNLPTAIDLYKRAADTGYNPALTELGLLYSECREIDGNYKEAVRYFLKAAPKNTDAKRELEMMFKCPSDKDCRVAAVAFLAEEWPQTHGVLNENCRKAILELFLRGKVCDPYVPTEIVVVILRWLIRFWPGVHYVQE